VFSVAAGDKILEFPYAQAEPVPAKGDYVRKVYADPELGEEAFTYVLESGAEGSVHLDAVLEVNRDPEHLQDLMLYHLTLGLQKAVEESGMSKRELIKRLKISPSQFYRLLDPCCLQKSVGQIFTILYALSRDLEVVINCPHSEKKNKKGRPTRYTVSAQTFRSVA